MEGLGEEWMAALGVPSCCTVNGGGTYGFSAVGSAELPAILLIMVPSGRRRRWVVRTRAVAPQVRVQSKDPSRTLSSWG